VFPRSKTKAAVGSTNFMGCTLSRFVSGDIYSSFRASYQTQVSSGSCVAGNSPRHNRLNQGDVPLPQFEG
jgi:outer membrane lipoprotein SlyB